MLWFFCNLRYFLFKSAVSSVIVSHFPYNNLTNKILVICFIYLFLNEYIFCQLRTEVNKVLEVARTGKLVGASLDAKVHIYTSDAIMTSQLSELCTTTVDADTLNRLFITSQVCLQLQYSSGI